jgi:hypothetical protein
VIIDEKTFFQHYEKKGVTGSTGVGTKGTKLAKNVVDKGRVLTLEFLKKT